MPKCFVYIQKPDGEVIFNPNVIQFIHKRETGIYIKFLGDEEALHLEGEAAKAYWDEVYDLSNRFPKPDEEPFDPVNM